MRHNAKLRKLVADMGKIPVTFHKYDGRPSGNYAMIYMTVLGVVVRSFAPLQVKGWKQIIELQKKPMFDRLHVSNLKVDAVLDYWFSLFSLLILLVFVECISCRLWRRTRINKKRE